jgi:hypothetical protein
VFILIVFIYCLFVYFTGIEWYLLVTISNVLQYAYLHRKENCHTIKRTSLFMEFSVQLILIICLCSIFLLYFVSQVRHETVIGKYTKSTEMVVIAFGVRWPSLLSHEQQWITEVRPGFSWSSDSGQSHGHRYRDIQMQNWLPKSAHSKPSSQPNSHR